jgi:hypothetical protein
VTVSPAPNEPLSAEMLRPSGKTTVAMMSVWPVKLIVAVASTETLVYAPLGTTTSRSWASVLRAVPLQSLVGFAPGRTVPCHVSVTVWPTVVGTVS